MYGKTLFLKLSYNLEIRDIIQPYINSSDVAVKGDIIEFDGLKSYLPGIKILTYSWDFGDGNRQQVKLPDIHIRKRENIMLIWD